MMASIDSNAITTKTIGPIHLQSWVGTMAELHETIVATEEVVAMAPSHVLFVGPLDTKQAKQYPKA